jgi:hypothetical protein
MGGGFANRRERLGGPQIPKMTIDPLYICSLCDAVAYPDFISFEDLKSWCTHSIQRGPGSYVTLVVCPQCSFLTADQAMDHWIKRVRGGEIRRFQ